MATLPAGLRKELGALWPTWRACAIVMIGGGALLAWSGETRTDVHVWTAATKAAMLAAFGLGSIVMGAMAVGQEFTARMLPQLLMQPVTRARIALIKFLALAAAVLSLRLLFVVFSVLTHRSFAIEAETAFWMVTLTALFVAPWITLLTRSELAGAVVAAAMPVVAWIVVFQLRESAFMRDLIRLPFLEWTVAGHWLVMLSICAVAAIHGRRKFLRLEFLPAVGVSTIERRWPWIRDPAWASSPKGPRPWWRQLVVKELRLHGMTLAVSGIFVATLPFTTWWREYNQAILIHGAVVGLIAGAFAGAEERRFGTLEAQLLLPVQARWQWRAKVAVVFGVTAGLTVALLLLVSQVAPASDRFRLDVSTVQQQISSTLLVATCALYVSSLCTGGLRALLTAAVSLFGGIFLIGNLVINFAFFVYFEALRGFRIGTSGQSLPLSYRFGSSHDGLYVALAMVVCLAALRFGFENFRSPSRSVARVVGQVAWLTGGLMLGVALIETTRAYLLTL